MDDVALPNIANRNFGNASLAALAARPDLCVKVIDRRGRITAINDAGVKLLQATDGAALCGEKWSEMWTGADRTTIEMAVSCAFMGESSTHRLSFDGGEWEIDICPLLGSGNDYETVLAISRLVATDGPETCEIDTSARTAAAALDELTRFAALTAQMADWVSASGDPVPEDMAEMLNDLSAKCQKSVNGLRTG